MVILRKVAHTAGLPGGAGGDEPPASAGDVGDVGLIPGSGRPPGGGNGTPLQHSCLEDLMDRGAGWAMVRRVTQSWKHLK